VCVDDLHDVDRSTGEAAVVMVGLAGEALAGGGGCSALHVSLYQVVCFVVQCDAGWRLPLCLRGGVVDMVLWACGASMTSVVT